MKFNNRDTGLYIDGLGSSDNGAVLGQWSTSSSQNQQWTITTLGTGRESVSEFSEPKTEESGFAIYPNPFFKSFTLEIPGSEQLRIKILDATGKEVEAITHSGDSNKLSLGGALKPGLYIIQVNSARGSQSFKVLKE